MAGIETIIRRRRNQSQWDQELWDFVERVECIPRDKLNDRSFEPSPLEFISDAALQERFRSIERNIQYLDTAEGPRDDWSPERGWLSPWWWLRLRHWTLSEFTRRNLAVAPSPELPPPVRVRNEFIGIHAGSSPKMFRLSRLSYLMEMLEEGKLRFAPAASYEKMEHDCARSDDEMTKGYKFSGRRVPISKLDGTPLEVIGEVSFNTSRMTDEMVKLPYWMLCGSTDFDPRLFSEFGGETTADALLAIFDPEEFRRRAWPVKTAAPPQTNVYFSVIDYYDVYSPPGTRISPTSMKSMCFAYQREVRFVVDPGHGPTPAKAEKDYFVSIGPLTDIAAVYRMNGRKVAGTGPGTFLR
jgi:hypothetical protein